MVLVLLVVPSVLRAQPAAPSTPSGTEAILKLKDLQEQEHNLNEYRGKILVVNFWATWCVPCREEMPMLVRLKHRYGARGVEVIGAAADDESTQASIPQFVRKTKITFPIWVGAATDDMQRFGLGEALPATAIMDRNGQIVGRIIW
jgi:thiol-disulfide isomerase/thioredoxin